jgi:hypothetical protein
MALVAILTVNVDFLLLLPWMATRAIPTSHSFAINLFIIVADPNNLDGHKGHPYITFIRQPINYKYHIF